MKITVAGMKYICYSQLIFRGNLIGGSEHFGKTRTRHNCVLNHRVRRNASDRPEGSFAGGPKFLSLMLVSCAPAVSGSILKTDPPYPFCFVIESGFDPIEFNQ